MVGGRDGYRVGLMGRHQWLCGITSLTELHTRRNVAIEITLWKRAMIVCWSNLGTNMASDATWQLVTCQRRLTNAIHTSPVYSLSSHRVGYVTKQAMT